MLLSIASTHILFVALFSSNVTVLLFAIVVVGSHSPVPLQYLISFIPNPLLSVTSILTVTFSFDQLLLLNGLPSTLNTITGGSLSTFIVLFSVVTLPAISLTLYVTFFVPAVEVSIAFGVIVYVPSIPDKLSSTITPLFKSTLPNLSTVINSNPSMVGAVLSNLKFRHILVLSPNIFVDDAHI